MKVCVIKTSSMGDVIHTLPALTDAQRAIPNLSIDLGGGREFCRNPTLAFGSESNHSNCFKTLAKIAFFSSNKKRMESYRTLLQANQYDAVIDAQGLFKSAFLRHD